jgi:hypothetical protein
MNDKKNIDRLFQERFKDFESVPNDKIWNHIHDALHEKKKRKVIPLWWKFSGIAAGFMLAFFAFQNFGTRNEVLPAVVVSPKEIENTNTNINQTKSTEKTGIVDQNHIATDEIATENEEVLVETNSLTNKNTNSALKNSSKNKNNPIGMQQKQADNSAVANKVNESEKAAFGKAKKTLKTDSFSSSETNKIGKKEAIVSAEKNAKSLTEKISNTNRSDTDGSVSTLEANKISEKNAIVSAENKTKTSREKTANTENSLTEKEIADKKLEEKKALALTAEPNPLVEILKKKKETTESVAEAKINRWQVSTSVAPVYFNSATNGSPIEAQFEGNSKSYENNLSMGVGVQYAVNKKLAVRAGINKVTLGYGTNDVVFFGAIDSPGFSNLSPSDATASMEVVSANNFDALRPFEDNMQNLESGVLNQRMGYYEVPLELSYSVLDQKFGVNLIGGVSTLFLNENSVSVQSESATFSLGQASNLNNVHFSSNVGVGFTYKFWKNLEARFEPTFKYQFNTFSRDAGNFKPYFVGLYTGVSYRF